MFGYGIRVSLDTGYVENLRDKPATDFASLTNFRSSGRRANGSSTTSDPKIRGLTSPECSREGYRLEVSLRYFRSSLSARA